MEGVIMGGGVSFFDGHIDETKCCENCVYYDADREDMPCYGCNGYNNWEKVGDDK